MNCCTSFNLFSFFCYHLTTTIIRFLQLSTSILTVILFVVLPCIFACISPFNFTPYLKFIILYVRSLSLIDCHEKNNLKLNFLKIITFNKLQVLSATPSMDIPLTVMRSKGVHKWQCFCIFYQRVWSKCSKDAVKKKSFNSLYCAATFILNITRSYHKRKYTLTIFIQR